MSKAISLVALFGALLILVGCPSGDDDDAGDDDASGDDDATADDDTGDVDPDDDTSPADDDTTPTDDDDSGHGEMDGDLYACMGGGTSPNFTPEYNDGDCPYDCGSNTPPVLHAPVYRVNGFAVKTLAPQLGDVVEVLMAYEDAECNVKCGSWYASHGTPEMSMGDAGSLPTNLPCDTASSGLYFGFRFEVTEAGEYSWMLRIVDECGAESDRWEDALTI